MTQTLWLCLEVNSDLTVEIVGIFDREQKAVDACRAENYCIGPLALNRATHESVEWAGAYYPLVQEGRGGEL